MPLKSVLLIAALFLAAGATVGASGASAAVLNLTLDGAGTGMVTSNPAGIECSNVPGSSQTACSHDFGPFFGTGTLTATASEGSAFLAWSGSAGGTCSGATNPCTTAFLYSGILSATATFALAPDQPTVATGDVSDIEFPSATLSGSVNPNSDDFAVQECYFEYGLTTEYGEKSPCHPGSIGTGTAPVAVNGSIGALEPASTYHYRLVSTNGGGTSRGADRTFTSAPAPADGCQNAAIRAEQGALAQRLPNCGAYELVSPLFTAGADARPAVGTADGNSLMLYSPGGFAEVENLPDTGVHYRTERTASGWRTSAIAPPASRFPYIGSHSAVDWTRDGSRSLWFGNLSVDEGTDRFTPIVRDPDGSFHVAGPTQDDPKALPVATSADLLTVAQTTVSRPPLTDGTVDDRITVNHLSLPVKSLYISTREPDGQLSVRQVAYQSGETMFPDCSVAVGGVGGSGGNVVARNAISADGSKIFFSSDDQHCTNPETRRVWAKVGEDDPIDLSASQCAATCGPASTANFKGASRDGSRVYFTTEQRLLPEDQDTSARNDLYEYDFNATDQKLRVVTGGDDPAGAGVTQGALFRASDDGAYAYFVATGRALTGSNARGVAPQPGSHNLYVYHRATGQAEGTITFVGSLGSISDYHFYPHLSSTGRYLLLQTTADMVGERVAGDSYPDLYRYDSQEEELLRVWTNAPEHNGAARVGGATMGNNVPESSGSVPGGGMQRSAAWTADLQMSDDGSMVGFTTAEPLSSYDRNTATDAYLWQADSGQITMLTDGTSKPRNRFSGSEFSAMTPSGDSLFVRSASPLLSRHTSGQNAAYVIRRNGGFPGQLVPPEPCAGDVCQGSTGVAPARSRVGSVDPAGSGNAQGLKPLKVSKSRRVAWRVARLRIRVPGAGRLRVGGPLVRSAKKSVGRARTVNVPVALNRKAKRALAKRKSLRAKVRVVFQPRVGDAVKKTVAVTFRQRGAKKKGGR